MQSFYDLFNEDIDILLPDPPPELKRLYDLFSIKISKLIGDYNKEIKLSTSDKKKLVTLINLLKY